jgi:hypothetical protein
MDRIDPTKIVGIDDRKWILTRAGPDEQFEVEVILLRLLGPAAAVGLGVVIDALAKEVASFLADVAGKDSGFDLANIGDLDTSDERLAKAWNRLLEVLPEIGGSLLGEALPVLLLRLDHKDLHRLMQLVVFGKVCIEISGKGLARVTDFKVLAALLIGSAPSVKWQILAEALKFNYADEIARAQASRPGVAAEASEGTG